MHVHLRGSQETHIVRVALLHCLRQFPQLLQLCLHLWVALHVHARAQQLKVYPVDQASQVTVSHLLPLRYHNHQVLFFFCLGGWGGVTKVHVGYVCVSIHDKLWMIKRSVIFLHVYTHGGTLVYSLIQSIGSQPYNCLNTHKHSTHKVNPTRWSAAVEVVGGLRMVRNAICLTQNKRTTSTKKGKQKKMKTVVYDNEMLQSPTVRQ